MRFSANFLGAVLAGSLFVLLYRIVLWFLRATDVIVGYNWSWEGTQFPPNFEIRNRSWTKQYRLANIAYARNNGKEVMWFDNKAIWDEELPPNSIRHFDSRAGDCAVAPEYLSRVGLDPRIPSKPRVLIRLRIFCSEFRERRELINIYWLRAAEFF